MIRFLNVSFWYRPAEPVIHGMNIEIPGGLTLLLGPNGAGKSTWLKLAAGIERPDAGNVEIEGCDLWRDEVAARRRLVYVSEQPDLTPYATIQDIINLVCRLRSEPRERGREALGRAGLQGVANRSVRELSMGQRRRAVLAAAWIGSPRVALMDEPLESMDRGIRDAILLWIDGLLAAGAAVVIATHEIESFLEKASRALVIVSGQCRQFEPLPADAADRLALLEKLSRGTLTPGGIRSGP